MAKLFVLLFISAVLTVKVTSESIRVKRWGGDSSDDLSSMFRGTAGVDYPNYKTIPQTSFQCSDQLYSGGLYADVATQCQVYHVCQEGRKDSFLCGKGTIFNQQLLTCDYWYSTDCETAPNYYYLNSKIADSQTKFIQGSGQLRNTQNRPGYSQGTPIRNIPEIPQKKTRNQGSFGQSGYGQNDQRVHSGNSESGQYNKPFQNSYDQTQQSNQQGIHQKPGKLVGNTGQYIPGSLPGDTGYYSPDQLPGDSGQYRPESIPGDSGQYKPQNIPGDSGQYIPAQLPGDSGQYYSGKVISAAQLGTQGVTSQGRNQYQPAGNLRPKGQQQTISQSSSGYQPQSGQFPKISSISYQQPGNNRQSTGISKGPIAPVGQQNQGHNADVSRGIIEQRQQSGPWSFPNGGMMMMGGPGDR